MQVIRKLPCTGYCLSFDDGPNSTVTRPLLRILADFGISAIFFVTGASLKNKENRNTLFEAIEQGHIIGNHGLLHVRGVDCDFEAMTKKLRKEFHIESQFIRPPYGDLEKCGTEIAPQSVMILWSAKLQDWLPSRKEAISSVFTLKNQDIILLHDGVAPNCEYLDRSFCLELTSRIVAHYSSMKIPHIDLRNFFPSSYRVLHKFTDTRVRQK
ncbi:MAG: polysaccharide deacetylase [Acidobacteriales bacterium]|nr:polysaccharide deacetylase [Terriglobales bacterium]